MFTSLLHTFIYELIIEVSMLFTFLSGNFYLLYWLMVCIDLYSFVLQYFTSMRFGWTVKVKNVFGWGQSSFFGGPFADYVLECSMESRGQEKKMCSEFLEFDEDIHLGMLTKSSMLSFEGCVVRVIYLKGMVGG